MEEQNSLQSLKKEAKRTMFPTDQPQLRLFLLANGEVLRNSAMNTRKIRMKLDYKS